VKTTITSAERLQLMGLVALAERYSTKLEDVLAAGVELLGAEDNEVVRDHITDALYNGQDLDEMLQVLAVRVEEPTRIDEVEA
jgi:hypothetical protein